MVLTSGELRVDLTAQLSTNSRPPLARAFFLVVLMAAAPPGSQDASRFRAPSLAMQTFLAFQVANIWVSLRWSVPSVSRSIRIVPGVESRLLLTSGGFRVELSAQQFSSLSPSTGTYGCYGLDGGWSEGAFVFFLLQTVRAVPHGVTAAMACPTLCGQGLRSRSPWFGAEVDG